MDALALWRQLLGQPHPALLALPYLVGGGSAAASQDDEEEEEEEEEEDEGRGREGDAEDGREGSERPAEKEEARKRKRAKVVRTRYPEEYRCDSCPYTCTTERAFLKHFRFCGDGKNQNLPLSCPVCGKNRNDDIALSVHMEKHREGRHFCCDLCKFKSIQLKKIIQHRRMHTGEKPHLCPHCCYRSSRRDNLRCHVRRMHKKKDLDCDTFVPRKLVITPKNVQDKDEDDV